MRRLFFYATTILLSLVLPQFANACERADYDLVVYGGTSSGVAAAVQAMRMQLSVVIVEPTDHVGGLTTNGLGYTDTGDKRAIGGIAREFYQAVKKHYDDEASWQFSDRAQYSRYRPKDDAMWTFEPHVAEKIFEDWLKEYKIPVLREQRLDRSGNGVRMNGKRVAAIRLESGQWLNGRMFIDATYEGDLLAAAGVSYTVGREANAQHGEQLNGVQRRQNTHNHRFKVAVDPFIIPGDPKSGLVAGVPNKRLNAEGDGDTGLQAFCYRMCMTQTAENLFPFPKPKRYDESQYELLFRNFEAGDLRWPLHPGPLANDKTDTNNNGAFSTDYIGANHNYAEASYEEREAMLRDHKNYQQGLMWTLGHHPRVPEAIRRETQSWGLAKDEFQDNGHWPRQIYVREARRMVSEYVMSELDCGRERIVQDPVGLGSYNMDSHNVHRYITDEGYVQNEGDVQVSPGGAYLISYRSIRPRPGEAENLFAPVCLSASHIAFGSIRMEPVFMILGQSAATAAGMAIEKKCSVQEVPYAELSLRLLADRQVLTFPKLAPPKLHLSAKRFAGVIVDDRDAEFIGDWSGSSSNQPHIESGYHHDGNSGQGTKRVIFRAKLKPGRYQVRAAFTKHANRATRVKIVVHSATGEKTVTLNQRKQPSHKGVFETLGLFSFRQSGVVEVLNDGADGYVIADAIQFEPAD